MKKRVYKYQLPKVGETIKLDMFQVHKVIHFNEHYMWVEVTIESANANYTIFVAGTGQEIPVEAKHIGTYFEGIFVWHIYYVLSPILEAF